MKYVYPAIFRKDKEMKDTRCIEFPDVEGAATQGDTLKAEPEKIPASKGAA